jgi:hypothetical protein
MPAFRPRPGAQGATRAAARKVPGGRYAGIRSSGSRFPTFKPGRYRLEILETRAKSRNNDWFHFDAKVLDAEQTADAPPNPVGATVTGMMYIAGKGADVNLGRIKKMIMSTMGIVDDDVLDEEEPDWDVLLDAVMSDPDAEADERFGVNPLQGQFLILTAVGSGNIDEKTGTEYCNYHFEPDEEG